jgi:hypothetical protein
VLPVTKITGSLDTAFLYKLYNVPDIVDKKHRCNTSSSVFGQIKSYGLALTWTKSAINHKYSQISLMLGYTVNPGIENDSDLFESRPDKTYAD